MLDLKKILVTWVILAGISSVPVVFAQSLNLAPDCSQAVASPNQLWPPNNKLIPIQITGISDPDNDAITVETQCITQDEPVRFSRRERSRYRFDADGIGTNIPSVKAKRSGSFVTLPDGKKHRANGRVYDIIFKATDAQGAVCSGKVSVQVPLRPNSTAIDSQVRYPSAPNGVNCDGKPLNNAPAIYSEPVVNGQVGTPYQYTVTAHDPDSQELTYSLTEAPDGASIDAQTGILTWTPLPAQEGQQTLVVKVSDTGGLSATQSFDVTVEKIPDQLSVSIVANPTSGSSPLTVRFSPDVNNNNIVFKNYAWDFNSDGRVDASDGFGAPKTYTFTGSPGQIFKVTLTVTPAQGDPLVATQNIIIDNQPPTAQVSSSVTNGHAPLSVTFTVAAQDPQGIKQVSIDFDGDGIFDATQNGNGHVSGSWVFQNNYQNEGYFLARVKVTDMFDAETLVTNNAITVDVNNPKDPVVQLSANTISGNSPLAVTLSASATLFDNSTIAKWKWDLDGDGTYETTGGTGETDRQSFTYRGVSYYYPAVEVTTDSGRKAKASLKIETRSTQKPALSIPNSSDTINTDAMQIASFNINLPYETELEIWMENAGGKKIKTIYPKQLTTSGNHEFTWDGKDEQGEVVSEGDYYVVLGYSEYGINKEIDLRTSTGGRLSYYARNRANPRFFDRLEQPLRIDYAVDDPAEVSFFWQISFGERLMTLMEHERLGRGQYSLYWNGEFPSGKKIPNNLNQLMPGIVRYALPDNVIFVKSMPRIENYALKSTVIADPRREPIEFDIELSKAGTVELVVSDMDKGVDVARRIYADLSQGQHTLLWDGKNDDDQLLYPGDYRMGVRSVDQNGSRSLFWYRTQRIYY